jgi:hypothetical protein
MTTHFRRACSQRWTSHLLCEMHTTGNTCWHDGFQLRRISATNRRIESSFYGRSTPHVREGVLGTQTEMVEYLHGFPPHQAYDREMSS